MGVPGLFAWLARRKYPEVIGPLPEAASDAQDGSDQSHADNLYIGAPDPPGSAVLLPIAQMRARCFCRTQRLQDRKTAMAMAHASMRGQIPWAAAQPSWRCSCRVFSHAGLPDNDSIRTAV